MASSRNKPIQTPRSGFFLILRFNSLGLVAGETIGETIPFFREK